MDNNFFESKQSNLQLNKQVQENIQLNRNLQNENSNFNISSVPEQKVTEKHNNINLHEISKNALANSSEELSDKEQKQRQESINKFTNDIKSQTTENNGDNSVDKYQKNIKLHQADREIPSTLAKRRTEFFIGTKEFKIADKQSYSKEFTEFKKKHEDFLENNEKLKAHKRIKRDTGKMTNVKNSLDELNVFLKTKPQATTPAELEKLRPVLMKYYTHSIELCQIYESSRDPITTAGKERKKMVTAARQNCQEELSRLKNIDFESIPGEFFQQSDFTWADILFYTNAIHIDQSQAPEKVNEGCISDVYKVKQKNGDKEEVSYFSREHKFITYDVRNYILKTALKAVPKSSLAKWCNELVQATDKAVEEVLKTEESDLKNLIQSQCSGNFKSMFGKNPETDNRFIDYLKNQVMFSIVSAGSYGRIQDDLCERIVNSNPVLIKLKNMEGYERESIEAVCNQCNNEYSSQITAKNTARIEGEVNLSRRNVASTVVADTFGLDFVCKSRHATLLLNGEYCTGNLMKQAEGESFNDMILKFCKNNNVSTINSNYILSKVVINYSTDALRQMQGMQIFDIFCGQTDRHQSNLNYIAEVGEQINLKGINLFDNDMAFGTLPFKDVLYGRRYMSGLLRPTVKGIEGRDSDFCPKSQLDKNHPLNYIMNIQSHGEDYLSSDKTVSEVNNIFTINEQLREYYENTGNLDRLFSNGEPIFKHFDKNLYDKIISANPIDMLFKMKGCEISFKDASAFLDRFYGIRAFLKWMANRDNGLSDNEKFLYTEEQWKNVSNIEDIIPHYNFSTLVLNLPIGKIGKKIINNKEKNNSNDTLDIKKHDNWASFFKNGVPKNYVKFFK